jgi:uncharacterized phage protein gp47/JayE
VRYHCCEERRLEAVRKVGALNAVEYVEVLDGDAPPGLRQRVLLVRLLKAPPAAPAALGPPKVDSSGGQRAPTVAVQSVTAASDLPAGDPLLAALEDPGTVLFVQTASRGDFSRYELRLVASPGSALEPAGFDPLLSRVEFSFKVECPSDFDCGPACDCEGERRPAPTIDYLAKDYDGFRRLMLDRLSLLAPDWTERNAADVGMTLVELLAYVGDELSYRQDAVATEAYLATARRRTSLRRHARLVDYLVHEGCNSRAWVRVRLAGPGPGPSVRLERSTVLLTHVEGIDPVLVPGGPQERAAIAAGAETFETLEPIRAYPDLDELDLWTWGYGGCCLPRGATSATLAGEHPALKAGDVLVLAEVVSPTTAKAQDADPAKRAAVRLTHVTSSKDPAGGAFATPPTSVAVDVTEIAWDDVDALPFALCVSVIEHPGLAVAKAWGNIVLADHGRTIADEPLGVLPAPALDYAPAQACGPCDHPAPLPVAARYRPTLAGAPLTHAGPPATRVLAEAPTTAAVDADLAALSFGAALHDWLQARGVRFEAGSPVVRGADDGWSVSDGAGVALLTRDAGTLTLRARPQSATASTTDTPRAARPAITLAGTLLGPPERWDPQADLLASDGDAAEFVAEVEADGSATLRFGDGTHGRRPDEGTAFAATYRIGNGRAGNVGAGAIAHVATTAGAIASVSNPLPATGGTDPEAADAVRRDAPEAFLVQQRAVTADDYARMTERDPRVQRAAATFRWTGSWHTVFVTADRAGGLAVDAPFEAQLRAELEPVRMAGYDLEVDAPRFVALDVGLLVCVEPDYFRAHVRAAVLDVLSSRVRADGELGVFHPDRFTFGQPVYLSPIVAAAQAVPGVCSVTATSFQRQREKASSALDSGVLRMGRLEIARLDNDPSFPEHGTLELEIGGGK